MKQDDAYYRVNRTVVNERSATQVTYRVNLIRDGTADTTYDELSSKDKQMLVRASVLADESDEPTIEAIRYANESERPASALVERNEAIVRYDGMLYRVEPFARSRAVIREYQHTATRVATSDAAYLAYVDDEYTVDLDAAPKPARTFFANISDNGSAESSFRGTGGDGYVTLDRVLTDERTIENNVWLVRYEGERYQLSIGPEGFP